MIFFDGLANLLRRVADVSKFGDRRGVSQILQIFTGPAGPSFAQPKVQMQCPLRFFKGERWSDD
jgi:hypothetical protein